MLRTFVDLSGWMFRVVEFSLVMFVSPQCTHSGDFSFHGLRIYYVMPLSN